MTSLVIQIFAQKFDAVKNWLVWTLVYELKKMGLFSELKVCQKIQHIVLKWKWMKKKQLVLIPLLRAASTLSKTFLKLFDITSQKLSQISGTVHVIIKTDKLDYLSGPIFKVSPKYIFFGRSIFLNKKIILNWLCFTALKKCDNAKSKFT